MVPGRACRVQIQPGQQGEWYVTEHTGVAGSEVPLEGLPGNQAPSDWSPDGRFILFESEADVERDIWAVLMDGEGAHFQSSRRILMSGADSFRPMATDRLSAGPVGTTRDLCAAIPGRRGQRDAGELGWRAQARWAPMAPSCSTSRWPTGSSCGFPSELPPDSETSPKIGTPEALFPAQLGNTRLGGNQRQHYAVSPDGERFLMVTVLGPGQEAPITVILNWNPRKRPMIRRPDWVDRCNSGSSRVAPPTTLARPQKPIGQVSPVQTR